MGGSGDVQRAILDGNSQVPSNYTPVPIPNQQNIPSNIMPYMSGPFNGPYQGGAGQYLNGFAFQQPQLQLYTYQPPAPRAAPPPSLLDAPIPGTRIAGDIYVPNDIDDGWVSMKDD